MFKGLVPVALFPNHSQYSTLGDFVQANELNIHLKTLLEGGRYDGDPQMVLHKPEDNLGVY